MADRTINTKKVVNTLSSITSLATPKKRKVFTTENNRSASDPMRVALICPYSISIPGGVQNQVLLLAREMRDRKIDARIIAPCDGAPPTPYVIPVGTTRRLKSNGSLAPIVDDASSASFTLDAINSFGPDVIHLHEPLVPGPTTTAIIGAEGPMVATFHAAGEIGQTLKYFRHPARGAISRVHVRVAVSNEAKQNIEQYVPGTYEIVPNCVDVQVIYNSEKWPATKPIVLFVGRHEERKGLRYLIQAWIDSKYLQKNATLWVAGAGEETNDLIAQSKDIDSINYLGHIEYAELFRRMRTAQVLCAPALYGESFGIVLIEAMAANACVVASDIPGYRDVARNSIEALLVTPGDSDAIAEGIGKILKDDKLRNNLQKAGIKRSKEFSVQIVVDKYLKCYEQAIQSYQSARLT